MNFANLNTKFHLRNWHFNWKDWRQDAGLIVAILGLFASVYFPVAGAKKLPPFDSLICKELPTLSKLTPRNVSIGQPVEFGPATDPEIDKCSNPVMARVDVGNGRVDPAGWQRLRKILLKYTLYDVPTANQVWMRVDLTDDFTSKEKSRIWYVEVAQR